MEDFLIYPVVSNYPVSTKQISEYIHKSLSAFSGITNIDTTVSSMGIQSAFNHSGGYNVKLPKKNGSVKMTLAHYRTHVKPILENALNTICSDYEREFIDFQNRICCDVMKAQLECTAVQNIAYYDYLYNRMKVEYQMYACEHYHYLYHLAVLSFKDDDNYILFHIAVCSCPSILY